MWVKNKANEPTDIRQNEYLYLKMKKSYYSTVYSSKKFVPEIIPQKSKSTHSYGRAYAWSNRSVKEKVGLSVGGPICREAYRWRNAVFHTREICIFFVAVL